MTLDIGCGKRKIEPDAVGIDVSPDSAADRVWDLDRYPWPLADGAFSRIHMSHIIEHLEDPMRAMAEVYRVARDGADVFVTTPHFSSHNSYVDPTHRRHLAEGIMAGKQALARNYSITGTSSESMMRWSEVTSRSRCTRAVAAMTRSAGSRKIPNEAASRATSNVRGITWRAGLELKS